MRQRMMALARYLADQIAWIGRGDACCSAIGETDCPIGAPDDTETTSDAGFGVDTNEARGIVPSNCFGWANQ
jgi:hypothetical protein